MPRLITPFALVVVGAFVLCAGFGFTVALQSDSRHQDHQRAALVGGLGEFRKAFVDMTVRRANDVAFLARAAGTLSTDDLAPRLASSGLPRGRHDRSYLIAPDDRVIAASPPEAGPAPAPLANLVAAVRAAAEPDRLAADTDIVLSDVMTMDGVPALAAVAVVRGAGPGQRPALLARLVKLDGRLGATFEKMAGASGLVFDAGTPGPGREVQALLDANGRIVGWISWESQRPMMAAVTRLAPLLGFVGACLVGFAGLAVRQIRRATENLARSEAHAHKIAYQDAVTDLPNRRKLFDTLDAALAERTGNETLAFAFLDLDGFKEINETLGHQCGDRLLAEVAERLRRCMPEGATVGRLGADEFAILLPGADFDAASARARAAVAAVGRPYSIGGQAIQTGASVGLVEAPRDGRTRDELTRRADHALRSVKRSGRGRIAGFDAKLEQDFNDHLFVKRELARALADRALDVHYQPIVSAEGSRIVSVEALLRWNHPARGNIPPSMFVPIAEQSGLMLELGQFVLHRALADATRWKDVSIAVNLSPVQVRDRALTEMISEAIRVTGIAPERVVLEITEGVLIDDPDEARARLEQLRALGVKIALDDFGAGYSNLSYLRRFPIDKLKIDREFVRPLGRSADGGVIIQAIIALGRALGLTVVCEGVETEEQRVLLRLAGCDEMQGFLFAKPAPRASIDRLLLPARPAAPREAAG